MSVVLPAPVGPTIAVTCPWHGRSADRVRKRYPGARLLAVPDAACSPDSLVMAA